tara:strand:+ start:136 stop:369 length:234 start_codon:yes stop_codon:yes gene_type:complete
LFIRRKIGSTKIIVFKNIFNGKKKFKKSAIKLSIINPYISCEEKYSKSFLFSFDKNNPNGVNRMVIKKECKIIDDIK